MLAHAPLPGQSEKVAKKKKDRKRKHSSSGASQLFFQAHPSACCQKPSLISLMSCALSLVLCIVSSTSCLRHLAVSVLIFAERCQARRHPRGKTRKRWLRVLLHAPVSRPSLCCATQTGSLLQDHAPTMFSHMPSHCPLHERLISPESGQLSCAHSCCLSMQVQRN